MSKTKFRPSAGNETANSAARRRREGFYEKYFVGSGIDIGCGNETITPDARGWDIAKGDTDATLMKGVDDETYDFVYASHVLEHIAEPHFALQNWWRILKPGGHMVIAVPDEDLYEQGLWPSMFNPDHRHAFTASKDVNAEHSLNLIDLITRLESRKLISLRICDNGYEYDKGPPRDQPSAERQIEAVVLKTGPMSWRSTVKANFKCGCGHVGLVLLGVLVTNDLLTRCPACGQRGRCRPSSIPNSLAPASTPPQGPYPPGSTGT